MNKISRPVKVFVSIAVVLAVIFVYPLFQSSEQELNTNPKKDPATTVESLVKVKDGYTVTADYKGSNVWSYLITGKAPSPCHSSSVEVDVPGDGVDTSSDDKSDNLKFGDVNPETTKPKSEPKVIIFELSIVAPTSDAKSCEKSEEPLEIKGSFQAGTDAAIVLTIMKD